MKKSQMLRKAKKVLWDGVSERNGKVPSIYLALACAVGYKHAAPLCNIIIERLEGWPTVGTWLHNKCNISIEQLTPKAVQKHRHQWVDLMIKEFEAKGD